MGYDVVVFVCINYLGEKFAEIYEDDLPYVKATSEEVENFFETMTPKQKKAKKKVEDVIIMYSCYRELGSHK